MRLSEWPLALLALAIIPSLVLDDHARGGMFHNASEALNWTVWLAFCGELTIKAWLSHNTATIASFFFDVEKQERTGELAHLHERLQHVEQKQDELLAQIRQRVP